MPLLVVHESKLLTKSQIPKNKIPNPARTLAVKILIKGNAITKIPSIIAKTPNIIFLSSTMIKPPLRFVKNRPYTYYLFKDNINLTYLMDETYTG